MCSGNDAEPTSSLCVKTSLFHSLKRVEMVTVTVTIHGSVSSCGYVVHSKDVMAFCPGTAVRPFTEQRNSSNLSLNLQILSSGCSSTTGSTESTSGVVYDIQEHPGAHYVPGVQQQPG